MLWRKLAFLYSSHWRLQSYSVLSAVLRWWICLEHFTNSAISRSFQQCKWTTLKKRVRDNLMGEGPFEEVIICLAWWETKEEKKSGWSKKNFQNESQHIGSSSNASDLFGWWMTETLAGIMTLLRDFTGFIRLKTNATTASFFILNNPFSPIILPLTLHNLMYWQHH